jgi:hypothetical protein
MIRGTGMGGQGMERKSDKDLEGNGVDPRWNVETPIGTEGVEGNLRESSEDAVDWFGLRRAELDEF